MQSSLEVSEQVGGDRFEAFYGKYADDSPHSECGRRVQLGMRSWQVVGHLLRRQQRQAVGWYSS